MSPIKNFNSLSVSDNTAGDTQLLRECPVCFYPVQDRDMKKLQCCGEYLCRICCASTM